MPKAAVEKIQGARLARIRRVQPRAAVHSQYRVGSPRPPRRTTGRMPNTCLTRRKPDVARSIGARPGRGNSPGQATSPGWKARTNDTGSYFPCAAQTRPVTKGSSLKEGNRATQQSLEAPRESASWGLPHRLASRPEAAEWATTGNWPPKAKREGPFASAP